MLSPFYFKLTPDERLEIVLSLCKDKPDLYSAASSEIQNLRHLQNE